MKPEKKEVEEPQDEEEGAYPEYTQKAENGDVYITVNASRGSTVNINRGQIPPPPPPKT